MTPNKKEIIHDSALPPSTSECENFEGSAISKWKALAYNLTILLISTALCFIAIEILYRSSITKFTVKPNWSDRPSYYYSPEISNGELIKGAHGRASDFGYEKEKPANTFRIAAIGDSFTFAPGMQFDDAYPKRLERILNLNNFDKTHLKAEVMNFGKWGASTTVEARKLPKILENNPDLVLLEITLNDPALPDYARRVHELFYSFQIDSEHHPLLYYWKSLGFIVTRIRNSLTHQWYIDFHKDLFRDSRSWIPFVGAIEKMKHLCDEKHVKFVAVIFPFIHYDFDARYPFRDVHQQISTMLAERQIPYLDLLPAFAGISPERLVLVPNGDKHPNEIAHRIVSEAIYDWFEKSKLIPDELILHHKRLSHSDGQDELPDTKSDSTDES